MRKSLIIFYFLITYVLAQLVWWGILLIQSQPHRQGMIMSETAVFICVFLVGAYYLQKSLKKERKLHKQQKNFLLSVTHELKSPLASIKLVLQTIQKRDLDETQKKTFIKNSLKDIERLDDLVEKMLISCQIDNQSYSFPKEEFNVSALVEKIADRLQIHTCNSQYIKTAIKSGMKITGDKFALTAVFTNLIENAVKYSPPGAEVDVKLFADEEGQVNFYVADQGIGIIDEEKPRIFDKFYRVGNEDTRKTKGTGLGLYIVKRVLDNHLASIRVKNNQPSGTVFEVTFNNYV
ncbi:MAG: HAMP domain-containing sensor histidine kinase [Daejeonella sp.]